MRIIEQNKELLLPYLLRKLKEDHVLIKDNIHYNDKKLKYRNHYLKLKHLIDSFIKGNVENRLIVMPGLRGVGKSTMMFQLYDYILNEKGFDNDRILYISADQLSNLGENIYNTIEIFINEIHQKSPVH